MSEAYLFLDVPDDQRVGAIAREAALHDGDRLDIERQLSRPDLDPGAAAALALVIGRAGWSESAPLLAEVQTRLEVSHPREARVFGLARVLAASFTPPPAVEAAAVGYRFTDARGVLYVEDPVAAHWHHQGRWGPPLRPDLGRAGRWAGRGGRVDDYRAWAADAGVVVVTFEPRRLSAPIAPLRLCRAGLSRAPSLEPLVRWSSIRSLGRWGDDQVAYERTASAPKALPPRASLPVEALLTLMGALSALGRGRPASAA